MDLQPCAADMTRGAAACHIAFPAICPIYIVQVPEEIKSEPKTNGDQYSSSTLEISRDLHQLNPITDLIEMSGGKKKSGPKHWLHSAKSIFKGHSKSSSSHSGVNTSGASSPGASIAPGSVVSLPSGSSQGGSNSLIPTGSAIVSGGSPVAPGQHRSRQNQPTVAGNSRTNPQANLTPAPAPAPAPALTPTPTSAPPPPDPNKDIVASIHVTITEIKTAQKALDDKKWYYTDRHGRQVDIGERMRRIVMSMEKCAKIVDVAIQHHPEISSLVWAGARFILMVS